MSVALALRSKSLSFTAEGGHGGIKISMWLNCGESSDSPRSKKADAVVKAVKSKWNEFVTFCKDVVKGVPDEDELREARIAKMTTGKVIVAHALVRKRVMVVPSDYRG